MGMFGYLAKKKASFNEKRYKSAQVKAEMLEKEAKAETEYLKNVRKQEKAKSIIKESRKAQHPLIYQIGASVQQKFKENKKAHQKNNMFASSNNNIFGTTSSTPYYLQPQKKGKKKDTRPYWLR